MMMKVLFLDIDGVLNSADWYRYRRDVLGRDPRNVTMFDRDVWEFDPKAVARLVEIIERTGIKIVISSSWRIIHTLPEIRSLLYAAGVPKSLDLDAIIIGVTPRSDRGFRGDEIDAWMMTALDTLPQIEKYAIIDDDSDFNEFQLPYFVHTSWEHGINDNHVDQVCDIIGVDK